MLSMPCNKKYIISGSLQPPNATVVLVMYPVGFELLCGFFFGVKICTYFADICK